MDALQYLESLCNAHPELSDWYDTLADLYQRKLWHQLTLKLELFLNLPFFQAGGVVIQLYHNFITDFETKISPLKLAHFAMLISRQYSEEGDAFGFLEKIIEKLQANKEQQVEGPIVCVKMQIAILRLVKGDQKECKKLLEDGRSSLDSMTDIDPSVYASYYWVSSRYHKFLQQFAEFYKSALLYLAYTSVESLPDSYKLDIAFDLSLSALLGDNIYNFGELLAHPIMKNTAGTRVGWLYRILKAFNSGDLIQYQNLRREYNTAIRAQPALVQNEKRLLEKINVLCLMEIFSLPSETRTILLSEVVEHTKLSIADLEYLVMKCLSLHLIEGKIDQVEGTVHVSWVQPRYMDSDQSEFLKERLDKWTDKVGSALAPIKAEVPDLIGS